jgi:hypothetical protein
MKTPADEFSDWFVTQGLNFDSPVVLSTGVETIDDNMIIFRAYGGAGSHNILPIEYPGLQINFHNRSLREGSENAWDAYFGIRNYMRQHFELLLPTWKVRAIYFNQTPQDMGSFKADNGEVYYWTVFNILLDIIKRT